MQLSASNFKLFIDIQECESSPCINGSCHDGVNNYTCECTPGFTGVHCETGISRVIFFTCSSSFTLPETDKSTRIVQSMSMVLTMKLFIIDTETIDIHCNLLGKIPGIGLDVI